MNFYHEYHVTLLVFSLSIGTGSQTSSRLKGLFKLWSNKFYMWISLTTIMILLWEKLNLSKLKMKVTSNMVCVPGCTEQSSLSEAVQCRKRALTCLMSNVKLAAFISRCCHDCFYFKFTLGISSAVVVISF